MKTKLMVYTEFGTAEFAADSPEDAHKALKSKLRKVGLSIKKLRYLREMQSAFEADVLDILYSYAPTTFRYEQDKAQALAS